jgi:predicted RNA-binding protein with PUA-like domain
VNGRMNLRGAGKVRLMTKGNLSFVNHNHCEDPGILGTLFLEEEHFMDYTARNKNSPR